jgi:hypothetical protein
MIDLKDYQTKKDKGLINKVQKTNTGNDEALTYAVYTKQFKIDGIELVQLPDEVQAVTHVDLEARKVQLQEEIDAIDAFMADAVNGGVA